MSDLKPITVYCHVSGPNPKKIIMLLEELGVPYHAVPIGMPALKQEPYTLLNPNGRAPTLEDPNTGVKLWESGAMAMYLVEKYDPTNRMHHATEPEKYEEWQWVAYQISGQGPYFGQAFWFSMHASEKIPSAINRYLEEIERVTSVLNGWLTSHAFLVGGRFTYADLMFVPWAQIARTLTKKHGIDLEGKYPSYARWLTSMEARDSVHKMVQVMQELSTQ